MPAEFAYYEFVRGWPQFIAALDRLEESLRANGRPIAADMLLEAYGLLRDELGAMALDVSMKGTEILRRMEKQTRVRPDSGGEGGPRLGDSLFTEPVGDQSLMPGSVGVANENKLDATVEWWWTNEEGYPGLIGRTLYGFFFGGEEPAPPEDTMRGVHALFQPGYSPVSGGGVISEPIPARRFIEKSIPLINAEWKSQFDAIKARWDVAFSRVAETLR